MNRKDFKRYMQQGLGRCVLALREAENIEKYRDIVLWGCLHNLSYDTQCEGTRAAYIYQLVSFFHDDAYFVAPTIAAFGKLPRHHDWTFEHFCELLQLFAENGSKEARNTLYEKYDRLLSSLAVKRSFRSYDYERDNFDRLCISLTSLDGKAAFKKIAEDMGTLFQRNPHYSSRDFEWFFSATENRFGKKWLVSFFRQEAKRSDHIRCLYEDYQNSLQDVSSFVHKPVEAPHADSLIAEVNATGKLSVASRARFARSAGDDEKMQLALFALKEEELSKKAELLSVFQNEGFPIQHEAVIAYSKSDHERLREIAFDVLGNCKSAVVKRYAYELLDAGENTYDAIRMLISNYTPDDKSLLLSALHHLKVDYQDESGWHGIGLHILEADARKIKLPKECLLYIYETTLCSCCRDYAIRALAKHRWLTANIIEECRYDSNCDIAAYVNRYYPSK